MCGVAKILDGCYNIYQQCALEGDALRKRELLGAFVYEIRLSTTQNVYKIW